jgi:hypothetical protein
MIQKVSTFFIAVYLLVTGFIAAPSQYYFSDWQAYQNLNKSSVAQTYIDKLQLTDKSKYIIAGADPQIKSKADFNAACTPQGQMIELGCYISGMPDHIYVMQIQDPSVQKVMDVTAAHEFLHAAYTRLTPKKQEEVNTMLARQLPLIKDENLQKRLEGYAKTEPGQQNNELNSIFGTEYSKLTPELETYYAQYFKNRGMIVAWNTANTTYINGKEAALKKDKAQIQADKDKLDVLEARMNTYISQGDIALYNALVPSQNAQVRQINAEIKTYNADIASYNDLIASISNRSYSSFDQVK